MTDSADPLPAGSRQGEGAGTGVRVFRDRAAGTVMLDRPAALNALTTSMRAAIAEAFPRWSRDPETYAAVIASANDRAFCVGGDIREIASWGQTRMDDARASLAAEYALNWTLECFAKPTVSLIDGLVMGSGAGISLYGTHRVGGERYRFSMPETGIGLFPDDGVCWVFARMPDSIGMYLALTGRAIGRADAYGLGLLTHCFPAASFGEVREAIADAQPVDQVLDGRHVDPGPGELAELRPAIARCFGGETVEAIIGALRAEQGAAAGWAQGVLADLARRSPTSLKIAHRLVRLARGLDLRATLVLDYRLACRCLENHDFFEGVRAVLVDRDRAPAWRPARLEDVSEATIDAYFAPLGAGELVLGSRAEMQAFKR